MTKEITDKETYKMNEMNKDPRQIPMNKVEELVNLWKEKGVIRGVLRREDQVEDMEILEEMPKNKTEWLHTPLFVEKNKEKLVFFHYSNEEKF